jgi:phage tail-like protein
LTSLALVGTSRLRGETVSIEPPTAGPSDSFFFRLELAGQELGDYSECFGLGSSNEIVEDVPPTDAGIPIKRKTPGALEWHNITLKRSSPSDLMVAAWRKAMETGNLKGAMRDGAIVMFKVGSPEPVARWEFRAGWVASLRFDGSMEELIIVHEGLDRVAAPSDAPRSRSRTS